MKEEKNLLGSVLNQLTNKINQILDQNELEKQQELLERSNAMANVGHWEVDLTQNKVHWCDEVKNIHEVSEDFTPELGEGINFYKKDFTGIRQTRLSKKQSKRGIYR